MTTKSPDASRLIQESQIQEIRLVDLHAISGIRSPSEVAAAAVSVKFAGRAVAPPKDGVMYVRASVEVTVAPVGATEPVVTIQSTFELRYAIPADLETPQEELAAFAASNGVFHAWPYWRELVQSTFLRMNLPPLVLPVFRLADYREQIHGTARTPNVAAEGSAQST